MSDRIMNSQKTCRRLAPSEKYEKYEMFVSLLTGQATQREAAAKWGVDRSTVATAMAITLRTSTATPAWSFTMSAG